MTPTEVIALTAIGLSALTFVATQLGSKRNATAGYAASLEDRIVTLEKENARLLERNATLFEENLHLMKKLTRNGGTP